MSSITSNNTKAPLASRKLSLVCHIMWQHIGLIVFMLITLSHTSTSFIVENDTNYTNNVGGAMFVFGDSLVDAGNNNYLSFSIATAKSLPNGIDFPQPNGNRPTGRFTNGLILPDIIGMKTGHAMVPPSLAPNAHGVGLLHGVNYASGGGGILNNTGRIFVDRISMDVQVSYFDQTIIELNQFMSPSNVAILLSRAIYMVVVGANDFLDNYLFPIPVTLDRFLPSSVYIKKAIAQYNSQLMRIYKNGARKFIIVNIPALGCAPYQRSLQVGTGGKCNERANRLANVFNVHLKTMVDNLNANLPDAMFLYADAFTLFVKLLDNFQQYGFENIDTACCGALGSKKGLVPCRSFVKDCKDRSKFFFWDPYHPTQGVYEIFATEFYERNQYISPMNIRDLMAL